MALWRPVDDEAQYCVMCESSSTDAEVARSLPRPAHGSAVDPISLEPVDEVIITMLMDNSYDALMGDVGPARRAPLARIPRVAAQQFDEGKPAPGWSPSMASRHW